MSVCRVYAAELAETYFKVVYIVLLGMVGDNERDTLGKALVLLRATRCKVELVTPGIQHGLEPRYGEIPEYQAVNVLITKS